MRVIIIEDIVYKVNEREYNYFKEFERNLKVGDYDYFCNVERYLSEYIIEVCKNYMKIGVIDFYF